MNIHWLNIILFLFISFNLIGAYDEDDDEEKNEIVSHKAEMDVFFDEVRSICS